MPRHPRRRNPARKGRKGRARGRKSMPLTAGIRESQQNATIIETIEYTDLSANALEHCAFTLAEFPRARTIANYFQFFKAKKVVWTYEPLYNTFQDSVGGITKPYLYVAMNRIQRPNTNVTREVLQAQGAQPQAFTGKKVISYVPNWCSPGLTAIATAPNMNTSLQGLKAQYSWLASNFGNFLYSGDTRPAGYPTIPSPNHSQFALYNGHFALADMTIAGADQPLVARVTCTVHWVFKGARFDDAPAPPSTTVTLASADASAGQGV